MEKIQNTAKVGPIPEIAKFLSYENLLPVALQYHAAGLKVIPWANDPDPKKQFPAWKKYIEGQSIEQVRKLFANSHHRICLICCDGIEAIDIDVKADPLGTIGDDFFNLCREDENATNILQKCVIVRTKSGGWHIIYKASNIEGNQKLAYRSDCKEAMIETRGIGGLLFVAPSPGYTLDQGNYCDIPYLTDTERNTLISIARLLNEQITDAPIPPNSTPPEHNNGVTSWDDYNERHTIEETAERYGWRVVGKSGDKLYLNRPGAKNANGVDATILTTRAGNRRFYVHTTSAHYNQQKLYTAFGMYATEEHHGDIKAAAKTLTAQGYGYNANAEKNAEKRQNGENCKSLIVRDGRYYWETARETSRGVKIMEIEISNFIVKPLFLLCHPVNPKRVFEVENAGSEKATICATAKEIAGTDSFRAIIEGKGNFVPSWNSRQFSAIKEIWYSEEKRAIEVTALGQLPDKNLYAFANGIFDCDANSFHKTDTLGIAEIKNESYFIPANSSINDGGNVYEHERRFAHNTNSTVTFEQWSDLFCQSYIEGNNGRAGVVFACAAMFRDVIFQSIKSFPILFLFGPKGTGKSSFLDALLSLFGQPQRPISLEGASTPKGFNRRLAQFVNALIVFEEYRNSIPPQLIGMLKSAYDGIGYERAETSNDNRTHTTPVCSAPIVTGNELPTQNSALFSRTVMVEFSKDKFTEQEKTHHNALMDAVKGGVTSATLEILKYRADFKAEFPALFRDTLAWLRREATADPKEQRSLENLAVMLATYRVLEKRIKFPFSLPELKETLISKLKIQADIMSDNSETAQFFRAFEVMVQQGKVLPDRDFRIKDEVLSFYKAGVFSSFRDYIKRTGNGSTFDDPTLERYLKQHPAYISSKDGDKVVSYVGVKRRSLCFHLPKLNIQI